MGLPKLYSPTVDTIRVLLLPEASTVHLFGPNDSVTESDIRRNLKTGPAEDEVITAASGVASGIKYSGNDEILGRVMSPELMLAKPRPTQVTSRFITAHPSLDVLRTASLHGASQIDLRLLTTAQKEIDLEVLRGFATVYQNRLNLNFTKADPVEYTHRLDLLPGSYRLVFTVDAIAFTYSLDIPENPAMGEIVRAAAGPDVAGRRTPFEFAGKQLALNPSGPIAIVPVPQPGKVTWVVRQGLRIVWRSTVEADKIAMLDLPALPPGAYKLEAATAADSRSTDLHVPAAPRMPRPRSYRSTPTSRRPSASPSSATSGSCAANSIAPMTPSPHPSPRATRRTHTSPSHVQTPCPAASTPPATACAPSSQPTPTISKRSPSSPISKPNFRIIR